MAAGNRIIALLLKLETDEASRLKTFNTLKGLRDQLDKTAKSTLTVDEAGEKLTAQMAELARAKSLSVIADDAAKAAAEAGDWALALERVKSELVAIGASDGEIKKVAQALDAAQNQAADGGGGSRRTGGLGRLGREIKSLPAINLSGNLSTDALGKILYTADAGLTKLGATTAQVGAATLIAAPALIALTVALSEHNRQLGLEKAALTGALDAQTRYYATLNNFSSAQAAQELETETARLENLRQQRAETQNALDSAFRQAQAAFTDPLARVLDATGQSPAAQLRDQLKELDAQIASTEGYTTRLGTGIRNLEFAEKDALDAVERAIQQTSDFEQLRARTQVDAVHMQVRADSMTAAAREDRIREIQSEIAVLEQAKSSTELSWRAASQLNSEITALQTESEILRRTFSSFADTEAAAAAAAGRVNQTIQLLTSNMDADAINLRLESIDNEIDAIQRYNDASVIGQQASDALTQRIQDLRAEDELLSNVLLPLAQRRERERTAIEAINKQTDTYFDALEREGAAREKLAEAGQALQEVNAKAAEQTGKNAAEAEEKRNDIVAEGGDQRAELERKTQEAIRKIERDYARTKFRAIGERDSLEARMAQIAREDQLDDQRRADDEAATKLEEAQTKQLRSLEKSLQKQAEAQNTALVREQATKMQAYQRAQLDLMNSENYSASIRAQAINGRVIQETTAYQSMLFQTNYYMNAIVARFGEGLAQMYRQMANGLTPNSPAAYDLYGVTTQPLTQQTVTRTVDYRLNQYFQSAGITER